MAKAKADVRAATPKKQTPKAEHKAATTGDVKIDVATVAAAVNGLPAPTEATGRAWLAQYPESYTLTLASQTRAPGVLGEAWGWFQLARTALEGEVGKSIRYPLARLGFLGRCVLDLAGVLEEDRKAKRSNVTLKQAKTAAEALAQAVLSELRATVREAAGRHDTMKKELDERLAEAASATTVGELRGLAALLDEWFAHTDADVRELVASAMLTADDAANARRHADAVTLASTARRGKDTADRDSPEVSVREGRLLAEMRVLRNAFINARAQRDDKRIPALVPGPATRAIFGRAATPEPTPAPVQ
jgi:hypothetical protein